MTSTTPPASGAAEPLAGLLDDDRPFALLRRRTPGHRPDVVEVLTGPVITVDRIADIPLPERAGGPPALALVPFRQLTERGFEVTDDGTPLTVLLGERLTELPLERALAALPDHRVEVRDGAFDIDDERYARIVQTVLDTEIGAGQGANFVIRRTFTGVIDGFSRRDALALFGRLLRTERGAYWTFVVHTGDRVLLGASPEVHVRSAGDTVVMNPISGTYRYPAEGPSLEGLLAFLDDPKEIEELSMVVDEELKMMCAVGDQGGVVVGPRLREMAHLAHTEYELRGRSSWDVRAVLRETMFAATVTGSPVENACRVIARHEPGGRGYYAGALALLGRDAGGAQTLDSPILIRTADVRAADGLLRVPVGATLVRGSVPANEVAETHAKAAGVLTALGVRPEAAEPAPGPAERPRLAEHPAVLAALAARRQHLSPFWLRLRDAGPDGGADLGEPAAGRRVLVLDAEDTFTSMLAHLLRVVGAEVEVVRWNAPGVGERALAHRGPVVLGPGPGDPNDRRDPRMRRLRPLAAELLAGHRHGLVGVCLGHELLAAELGLPVVRKRRPHQGAQERIDLFGTERVVGFYNSYTARCTEAAAEALAARGVRVSRDAADEVHALRGPGFFGVQFHPESVLTLAGPAIVAELLSPAGVPAG
ncbi:anthranilate synthase family protein [Streptomyces sp. DSM 44915]|uniref:anthranilate synthase n=1 Tax=Streptomyces chisholmiae TaxID=3075540 RepID=A0ABU2JIY4_9ACTN|nr:anthranilate synthase family protein [Streptomyces sp. DSM 44915]MDT0264942.1 anthranilate synthase family protein [Streptomyces sp. DSM 44915]